MKPVKKCCYNCFHSRHYYVTGMVMCHDKHEQIADSEDDAILYEKSCDSFIKRDADDDIGNTLM